MPLSEQEQRLLDEMERHLLRNDADVVSAPNGARSLSYRNVVYGTILVLVGLGALVVGVSTQLIWVGVILAVTPMRGGAPKETPRQGSARASTPNRSATSFMDRMNDRWDRRQGGDR